MLLKIRDFIEKIATKKYDELELRFNFPVNIELGAHEDSVAMIYGSKRRESFYVRGKKSHSEEIEKLVVQRVQITDKIFVSASTETATKFDLGKTDFIRFKRRYKINGKRWDIHITKTFTLKDLSLAADYLKELFSGTREFEKTEVEAEVKNPEDIFECCNEIAKLSHYEEFCARYVEDLGQLIDRKGSTIKMLLNNPKMLSREIWQKINITNYAALDKSDGIRCLLEIGDQIIELTDINIEVKSNKLNQQKINLIILDCEKIKDQYYVFDIIFAGKNLTAKTYAERLQILNDITLPKGVHVKKITQIKTGREIEKIYKEKYPYDIDGVILNEFSSGNYWSDVYKWKPSKLLTVDFMIVPEGEKCYLMTGIRSNKLSQAQIDLPLNYKEIIKKHGFPEIGYIPIPFAELPCEEIKEKSANEKNKEKNTSEKIKEKNKENSQLKVGEFIWDEKWRLIKIREDKSQLISKGIFGNDYFTVVSTLRELKNPLTLEEICKLGGGYFQHEKTQDFRAPIKFNSFVKFIVMSQLVCSKLVIDIASGKGQDLFVYHGLGIKKVIFVEKDQRATIELESRTKLLGQSQHYIYTEVPHSKLEFEIINKSYEEFSVDKPNCSAIVCNLAVHYLLREPEDYDRFAEFCSGAEVVILTFFDSEVLKKFLPYKTDKYYVAEIGKNRITVKHHFADEYYEEYLVDTEHLIRKMAKQKFRLIRRDSFDKWLPQFARVNPKLAEQLTADDKRYCGFYQYVVFKL